MFDIYDADWIFLFSFHKLRTVLPRLHVAIIVSRLCRGVAAPGSSPMLAVVAKVATIAILAWVGAWDGFLGGGLDFSELLIRFVD
ncbi:MAG: hypothetical protein K2J12_10305 [Muribaculaceae bacterium]|nr:hypothetical protein [Muribaculaceae bacterium]